MYETLLDFRNSLHRTSRTATAAESREEMRQWAEIYFARLDSVLGEGVVRSLRGAGWRDHRRATHGQATRPTTAEQHRMVPARRRRRRQGHLYRPVYGRHLRQAQCITIAQQCAQRRRGDGLRHPAGEHTLPVRRPRAWRRAIPSSSATAAGQIIYRQTRTSSCPREEVQAYLNGLVARISAGEVEGPRPQHKRPGRPGAARCITRA